MVHFPWESFLYSVFKFLLYSHPVPIIGSTIRELFFSQKFFFSIFVHFWQNRMFWKADSKLYLTDVLHFGEKAEKPVKIGAKKEVF
jgi:hypothetical protein